MADGDVLAALRAKVTLIESSGLSEGARRVRAAERAAGAPDMRGTAAPSDERGDAFAPDLFAPFGSGGPNAGKELDEDGEPVDEGAGARAPRRGTAARAAGPRPARALTEEGAFRRIEQLCNTAEQCSAKLRARLLREGWKADQVEEALRRAEACLLLNDDRYASVLVRSRLSQRKGVPGIVAELRRLGYQEDYVRELVAAQMDEDGCGSEVQRALAVLEARPPKSRNLHDGAYRKLMGRGFGSEVSSEAATLFCERHS